MKPGRGSALLGLIVLAAGAALLLPPIPQPADYHLFADRRTLGGIANFMNVLSNAAFVLVGVAGVLALLRRPSLHGALPQLRPAYLVFFAGAVLIGLGSAWYHLAPDNQSLVWDRLPMTVSFMALVAVVIGEQIDAGLGRKLLWPLLAVGAASVLYWAYGEAQGRGDLRPYVLVQFLPMLLLPLMLLLYRSPFGRTRELWLLIGLYLLAKLAEFADAAIYDLGQVISGHSLKHLLAAVAMGMLLQALLVRRHEDRAANAAPRPA